MKVSISIIAFPESLNRTLEKYLVPEGKESYCNFSGICRCHSNYIKCNLSRLSWRGCNQIVPFLTSLVKSVWRPQENYSVNLSNLNLPVALRCKKLMQHEELISLPVVSCKVLYVTGKYWKIKFTSFSGSMVFGSVGNAFRWKINTKSNGGIVELNTPELKRGTVCSKIFRFVPYFFHFLDIINTFFTIPFPVKCHSG